MLKKQIFNSLKKVLPFIGLLLLIIYIYLQLNFSEVLIAFQRIHPLYILIAGLLTLPMILIRTTAWQIILKEQDISIGFYSSIKIFLIGFFYGSFTPGFYGQLMRIPYLKEKTSEPYGKLFINTFIETTLRTITLFSMILIGPLILAITLYNALEHLFAIKEVYYVLLILYITFIGILLYFSKKHRGEKIFHHLITLLIPRQLKPLIQQFMATFYNDLPKIKSLAIPFLLSIITWVVVFFQEYLFVIALGLDGTIPFLAFLFLYPIANVAGFIPITFAGVGIREIVAMEIFYTIFAVTKEEIAVFALMGFLITDVLIGFLGFLFSLSETIDTKQHLKNIKS